MSIHLALSFLVGNDAMMIRMIFFLGILISLYFQVAQARSVVSLMEIRQRNVMTQKWDISCGAAALGTILKYHFGEDLDEKDIAKAMMHRDEYVNNPEIIKMRLGFSLLDIKRYVEGMGYQGIGLGKLSFDDIVERAPMIVPVYIHGYNHFVVFRGVMGNRVLLADPAWGNRTLTIDQFMAIWIENPAMGKIGFQIIPRDGSKDAIDGLGLLPSVHEFVNLN
jgi:predicted double-glycine peptidase